MEPNFDTWFSSFLLVFQVRIYIYIYIYSGFSKTMHCVQMISKIFTLLATSDGTVLRSSVSLDR